MEETPIRASEMVRLIRDQLHDEIKGMTPEEFKEFVTREAGKALQPAGRPADVRCESDPAISW